MPPLHTHGAWARLARHVRNEYMNSVDRRRSSGSSSNSKDRDLCAHALSVVRISQYGVICSTASTAPPIDVNLWHWHAPLARPNKPPNAASPKEHKQKQSHKRKNFMNCLWVFIFIEIIRKAVKFMAHMLQSLGPKDKKVRLTQCTNRA